PCRRGAVRPRRGSGRRAREGPRRRRLSAGRSWHGFHPPSKERGVRPRAWRFGSADGRQSRAGSWVVLVGTPRLYPTTGFGARVRAASPSSAKAPAQARGFREINVGGGG